MTKNVLTDAIENTRKNPLLFNLDQAKKDLESKWNNNVPNQIIERFLMRYNNDCTTALVDTCKLAKVLHILEYAPYPEKVLMNLDYEKINFIAQKIVDLDLAYLFKDLDYTATIEIIKSSDTCDCKKEMAILAVKKYINNSFHYAINIALSELIKKLNLMMEDMFNFEDFVDDSFCGKVELSEETNQKMTDNYYRLLETFKYNS